MTDNITVIPEMLRRKDLDLHTPEGWYIKPCAAQRGEPVTMIKHREMHVPMLDEETARVIRMHEMMHARVSPDDWSIWVKRGNASELALRNVEELRVNFLTGQAGFNMKALMDGTEQVAAEKFAEMGAWDELVYFLPAVTCTGGLNKFITGVRRHNKVWADELRKLAKKLERLAKKAHKQKILASTEPWPQDYKVPVVGPKGMFWTETIAEMIDRIANPPVPPKEKEDAEQAQEQPQEVAADQREPAPKDGQEPQKPQEPRKPDKAEPPKPPVEIDKIEPGENEHDEGWGELRVGTMPLPRRAPGGLGVKRYPASRGRNPRFITRILTDPKKRVFERKVKTIGGVCLLDGSGSMHLKGEDIMKLTEAAPGLLVAMYRWNGDGDNLVILANKGFMANELPKWKGSNGVDLPAIQWAIQQRQSREAPVIWVTDGAVHGPQRGYTDRHGMACIKEVIDGNVILARNVADGVRVLDQLRKGRKPQRWFPIYWQNTFRRLQGKELR